MLLRAFEPMRICRFGTFLMQADGSDLIRNPVGIGSTQYDWFTGKDAHISLIE